MPTSTTTREPGLTRRLLGLSALVMGCWAVSIPAQAGLGDLVEGALEEVIEAPVVTTLPITLPPVTLPEVTIPPLVVDLPTVSTPEIVLPLGDGPLIAVPSIVISPPTIEIDPEGGIEINPEGPPVVVGGEEEPQPGEHAPATEVENRDRIAADLPTRAGLPTDLDRTGVAAITSSPTATGRPAPDRSVEIRLLRTISANPVTVDVETETLASTVAIAATPTSWLASLEAWLGIESLADILAIPIRLLTLLFRALFSAGSGLVAPASILVALAIGARGKLLPTAG